MRKSEPLYRQLETEMRERIASGVYRSGELLPTEAQLGSEFRVSRITVRRAMDVLAAERIVTRQAGSGTRVVDPDETIKSLTLTGFIEDAIPINRYQIVSDDHAPTPAAVMQMLQLPKERTMRRVVAVNSPGGQPLAVSEFYFPKATASRVRAADFHRGTPVVRLLAGRRGMALAYAEQVVEPVLPPRAVAKWLGIEKGTPVLRTLRAFFGAGAVPLQAVIVHHHPQRFRFAARLVPGVVPVGATKSA